MRLIWAKKVAVFDLLSDTLANALNALEADILKGSIKTVNDLESHRIKLAYFCTLLPYKNVELNQIKTLAECHVKLANLIAIQYCR